LSAQEKEKRKIMSL